MSAAPDERGGRRRRRLWIPIALALVVFALALEGGVRWIVLSEGAREWKLAERLRQPQLYGHPQRDDLYWLLQSRFLPDAQRASRPKYEPVLGWIQQSIESGTWRHLGVRRLDGRRPVLLYGDSFAMGMTDAEFVFPALLEATPLGRDLCMLNYGVGGYGLDQVYLLLRRSLDHFAGLEPIVIVGVLVQDDLDRCALSFRCWPKPRLVERAGRLEPEGEVVCTTEEAWEQSSARPLSYAWRLLSGQLKQRSFPADEFSEADDSRGPGARAIAEAVLRGIVGELEQRSIPYVFVLFHDASSFAPRTSRSWRDELLESTLDELGAPWVSTRPIMLARTEELRMPIGALFGNTAHTEGHYGELGNLVAFHAMLAGFERLGIPVTDADWSAVESREREAILRPTNYLRAKLSGPSASVRSVRASDGTANLVACVGEEGPTEITWRLAGAARRFVATASRYGVAHPGRVELALRSGDDELLRTVIEQGGAPLAIDLDLEGRTELVLSAADAGDGTQGDVLVLASPRFE